jgi:hypothetical protein
MLRTALTPFLGYLKAPLDLPSDRLVPPSITLNRTHLNSPSHRSHPTVNQLLRTATLPLKRDVKEETKPAKEQSRLKKRVMNTQRREKMIQLAALIL